MFIDKKIQNCYVVYCANGYQTDFADIRFLFKNDLLLSVTEKIFCFYFSPINKYITVNIVFDYMKML